MKKFLGVLVSDINKTAYITHYLSYFIIFFIWVFGQVYICTRYVLDAWRAIRSPGTGVTDGYELPRGHVKLNPHLLEE